VLKQTSAPAQVVSVFDLLLSVFEECRLVISFSYSMIVSIFYMYVVIGAFAKLHLQYQSGVVTTRLAGLCQYRAIKQVTHGSGFAVSAF